MVLHNAQHELAQTSESYFGKSADMSIANDGHDTSVTVAGQWARGFLTPLLTDKKFMKNTCVLLSEYL